MQEIVICLMASVACKFCMVAIQINTLCETFWLKTYVFLDPL